jgi:GNAT superfamily N-acetyltransferase
MPELRQATEAEITAICRESHKIWGAGLTFPAYRSMWAHLMEAPWARKHLDYVVWSTDGRGPLSSVKLYRLDIRCNAAVARATGVGAVFTPEAHRGRGYAGAMLNALADKARERGDRVILLFSDIGSDYYTRLGYSVLPAEVATGKLKSQKPSDLKGWELKPMRRESLPLVKPCHDAWCDRRFFAVLRDLEQWEFLLARAESFFLRLDGSDLSRRYRVAYRDGCFAGYLIAFACDEVWTVREAGAVDGDPATAAAILRAGGAEAYAAGFRSVEGWSHQEVKLWLPEWNLRFRPRPQAIPMILPLAGDDFVPGRMSVDEAFIPFLDQF